MTDDEAVNVARRLAGEEGIFAGFSSGENVAAALHLLQTAFKGKIDVLFPWELTHIIFHQRSG